MNFVNKYCMDEFCMAFFYLKEVSNLIYFFDSILKMILIM